MQIIIYVIAITASYLVGAIPFGFLIGKLHGIDIRKTGSGNIGATNVTRSVGKRAGRICFCLDFLKGAVPPVIMQICYPEVPWLTLGCCAATIAGHIFPIYLRFKGGKGVSTAAGAALALAPFPLLCAFVIWAAAFLAWRYVSLASIIAAISLPVIAAAFSLAGIGPAAARSPLTLAFLTAAAILTILRHRANIRRLFAGTENRFGKK